MRLSFFPTPSHRVFQYKPRFYDEKEEQLRKMYEKYGKEYPGDEKKEGVKKAENAEPAQTQKEYVPGQSIRGSFQRGIQSSRRQAGNQKLKSIIVVITLVIVFVAAYYMAIGLGELFKG